MFDFAVLQDNLVINIIYAENKEIAEQVTGASCVQYDPQTQPVQINKTKYIDGAFVTPEQ